MADRDAEIVAASEAGAKVADLARRYGLKRGDIGRILSDAEIVTSDNPLDFRASRLEASIRTGNCVRKAGCKTLRDVVAHDEKWWMEQRNFGAKSLKELVSLLAELGLKLGSTDVMENPQESGFCLQRSVSETD